MAQFIPRRDETLEADPHQKWLEKWVTWLLEQVRSILVRLAKVERELAANGKQTALINSRVATSDTGSGLPAGGVTGMTVRKKPGASAIWTTEWQGLMPEYWVTLNPAGASYFVSAMGLLTDEPSDEALSKTLLPPVIFSEDGLSMSPIDFGNFSDALGGTGGQGEFPLHLYVEVVPSFDGEQFTLYVPSSDNSYGVTAPIYTFELYNSSAFEASVRVGGSFLYYEGTSTPVLGIIDPFTNPWTIAPGFQSSWTVRNVKGWGAVATPVVYATGSTPSAAYSDPWFEANIARMRRQFNIRKDGALAVASLPGRVYNDTVDELIIGKVTAAVGTAPSGVAATFVVKKNGTSISSSFSVAAGTNTGTAVLTDTAFAVGDYLTVECTQTGSAADANVHIYAG